MANSNPREIFMKLIALIAFLPSTLFALDIVPTAEQPVCLQRVYDAKHMEKNPKQKLSELTVMLQEMSYVDDFVQPVQTYKYNIAQIIGRSSQSKEYYGNTAACIFNKEGSVNCQIDCDGGSFALKQRPSWINFEVTPNYYFPLFQGTLAPDMEMDQPSIGLDGDDKNNNVFRLEKVSIEKCEEALSNLTEAEGGC
jgi:hypothetical protein